MAQKRISRARKRDLEQPDEFLSLTSRLLDKISTYWKPISAGMGVLMVILAGVLVAGYFIEKAEDKAFVLLNQAMRHHAEELVSQDAQTLLVRTHGTNGFDRWSLLCAPHSTARVNGTPVYAGIRVLADRDAITLDDGNTVFFSCERLAQVVPFPGEDDGTRCIRCKLVLEPATPAVRCPAPGCGFWHHQSEAQPCWTYAESCVSCGHPTAFDAGFQWSPREL